MKERERENERERGGVKWGRGEKVRGERRNN